MLGIGIGEMLLIAGIALIVIGPEKFPDFAKIFLRTMRDLRGYVDDIQHEISKEIKPIKRELNQLNKYDPEKYIDALTKENGSETGGNSAAKATVEKGAADPTDRQDDSFDYEAEDGYVPPGAKTGDSAEAAPEAAATPPRQTPESRAEAPAQTAEEDADDFEFKTPPVEPMD